MNAEEPIERVNWPGNNGKYEVVQLYVKGEPFLIFQESPYSNHSSILLYALYSLGLKKIDMKKDITGYPLTATKGEDYKVTGMGRSKVNAGTKGASFSGESEDYGMSIDKGHLRKINELEPDWILDF